MSSGSPTRPSGIRRPRPRSRSDALDDVGGQPCPDRAGADRVHADAVPPVRRGHRAREGEYRALRGGVRVARPRDAEPRNALTDAVLMIEPPPARRSAGRAARLTRYIARTFTSSARSHLSSSIVSTVPPTTIVPTPALLNTTSRRPPSPPPPPPRHNLRAAPDPPSLPPPRRQHPAPRRRSEPAHRPHIRQGQPRPRPRKQDRRRPPNPSRRPRNHRDLPVQHPPIQPTHPSSPSPQGPTLSRQDHVRSTERRRRSEPAS